MFKAFIIVCAASNIGVIDNNTCLTLADFWGPYYTQENCNIRASQMVDDVLTGELNEIMFQVLGNPELIYAEGYCEKETGELL